MKNLFSLCLSAVLYVNTFAAVTITPATLPAGNVKHPYSQLLQAQGGRKPYTWTNPTGTLPAGLLLTSNTQMNAYLAGTPTTAGTYTFTVRATDANGSSATNSYTVTITQLTFTDQQATDVWCRSVPDCPGIWDTWNSFYNLSNGTPVTTPTVSTTTVSPTFSVVVNTGSANKYTTVNNFHNVVGNLTYTVTGNETNTHTGNVTENVGGTYESTITNTTNRTYGNNLNENVTGTKVENVSSTYSVTALGLHTIASPTVSFSGLVGIGTTAPAGKLSVVGTGSTSATYSMKVHNSANSDLFSVMDNGWIYAGDITNYNLFFGRGLPTYTTAAQYCIALGNNVLANVTTGATDNIGIGVNVLSSNTSAPHCIGIGTNALNALNSASTGENIAIGVHALSTNSGVINYQNTAVGCESMSNNKGGENSAFGYSTLNGNGAANFNCAFGNYALRAAIAGATENAAFGYDAGYNTTSGASNTYIGAFSGYAGTSASNNTYLGWKSAYQCTGSGNIFLGYKAGYNQVGISNKLFIDNTDRGSAANDIIKSLVYGGFGADSSEQFLKVNGEIRFTKGINASAGDAATVQGQSGQFVKDNSGTTFTLTNALIKSTSIILLTLASDPGVSGNYAPFVVAGTGSAVITFGNGAPANNTAVNFLIINNN